MSAEKYKSIVEHALDCFSRGNLDGYLELYNANPILHFLPPDMPPGLEGGRLFYSSFLTGFPGAQLIADDMIIENNMVAVRYRVEAAHRGEFMGVPPTGKQVLLKGITIMRFEGDEVAERWNEADFLGLVQQLGIIPAPE